MAKINTLPNKESNTVNKSVRNMLDAFESGNKYKTKIIRTNGGLEYQGEVEKMLK
jgi:hypothetical protein